MNFSAYKTAIKTWVEAQTGLPAQWRNEAGGWHKKARIWLHLFASRGVGVDRLVYTQDTSLPAGADMVPKVIGNREVTLSILVESRDPTDNNGGDYYCEKLRNSLRKVSVREGLRAAGLAFATIGDVQDLSEMRDCRIESRYQMDVQFNAVANEVDTDEVDSYVETEDITGTLESYTGPDITV